MRHLGSGCLGREQSRARGARRLQSFLRTTCLMSLALGVSGTLFAVANMSRSANPAVTSGVATQLAFGTQPSNTVATSSITPAVTVQILDASGNPTTSTASVTLAIGTNPGGGTLSGTVTVAAVSGTATFNNLSIDKAATGYAHGRKHGTDRGRRRTPSTSRPARPASSRSESSLPTPVAAFVFSVTVQIQDAGGNLITTSTASVTLAIGTNPGGGTLSGTKTRAAFNGVATFSNLSIDKVGTGYTLTAVSTGLTGSTSAAFNITAGAAKKLAFGTQPSNTAGGAPITPAVTVQILDAQGNLTTSTAPVVIAIGTNAGGGTLSGTMTVAAVAGVATFGNLFINKTGTGYTLTAARAGLTGATSSAFNITVGRGEAGVRDAAVERRRGFNDHAVGHGPDPRRRRQPDGEHGVGDGRDRGEPGRRDAFRNEDQGSHRRSGDVRQPFDQQRRERIHLTAASAGLTGATSSPLRYRRGDQDPGRDRGGRQRHGGPRLRTSRPPAH